MNNILSKTMMPRGRLSGKNECNLSQRTIKANEELQKNYHILNSHNKILIRKSFDRVKRKNKRNKFIENVDKYDTTQMLRNTITDLEKTKFELRSIIDDGKTTQQLWKFGEYEIYVIENTAIYYRLELNEFKDKVFLQVKYFDHFDLSIYVSKSSSRPSKQK